MYCMCYNWWVLCRTQLHDSAQELNERVKRFGTQVGSPRVVNKSKQGIGRRIVVVQAEARVNHINKDKALIAGKHEEQWKNKEHTMKQQFTTTPPGTRKQ